MYQGQASNEDWLSEGDRFHNVYSNSILTLALF